MQGQVPRHDPFLLPGVCVDRVKARSAFLPKAVSKTLWQNVSFGPLVFCNAFGTEMDQAVALSEGLMEASSPLTSAAGLGWLNR